MLICCLNTYVYLYFLCRIELSIDVLNIELVSWACVNEFNNIYWLFLKLLVMKFNLSWSAAVHLILHDFWIFLKFKDWLWCWNYCTAVFLVWSNDFSGNLRVYRLWSNFFQLAAHGATLKNTFCVFCLPSHFISLSSGWCIDGKRAADGFV